MALTGPVGGPPGWPAGDVIGRLEEACWRLGEVSGRIGERVEVRSEDLLGRRAAWRGFVGRGQVSTGGRCRLLRASDGWVAVNLARSSDLDALAALIEGPVDSSEFPSDEAGWAAVSAWVASTPASRAAARAQLLEIPAAVLPYRRPSPRAPWSVTHVGPPTAAPKRRPLVVNLSAMWAGPLCAHLLGLAGADVVTVEDPARPDAARLGDPQLFELLHGGHRRVTVPFSSPAGLNELHRLLGSADVVIEGSRPRALGALGIDPARVVSSGTGKTWVSITGYGRFGPRANHVAFGDDAAVAGGLVAQGPDGPVFCGDAIADPITGLYAALGVVSSLAAGGGHVIDCALTRACAFANAGLGCRRKHRLDRSGEEWTVSHFGNADWVTVRRPGSDRAAAVGPAA